MHAPLSPVLLSALSVQGPIAADPCRQEPPQHLHHPGAGWLSAGLWAMCGDPQATLCSHQRLAVREAAAPLHDHVGELGRLDLGVVAPPDEVEDGQRGALGHGAGALPGARTAREAGGLQAAPGAAVRLESRRLQDPVLRPRQLAEADVVLLPAAGGFAHDRLLPALPRAPGHQGRNKNGCCDWKLGSGRNPPCC